MQRLVTDALAHDVDRFQANTQMLADALGIEGVGHAGQFDLAMQRLVGDAEQRAVRHAQAETVGRYGRRFHVHRDGTRLVEEG